MKDFMKIRTATIDDAGKLLEIYRPYVTDTAITFEYEVPTLEEFQNRIVNTLLRYPYLVIVKNEEIAGYAYASAFKERRAYDWAVETSIYIRMEERKKGYGKMLYDALEEELRKQHVLNLNACIAYTECEDTYLTNDSMKFHEHLGYRLVGKFSKCGCKFNRWYDMIWMEKLIGEHKDSPEEFLPYHKMKHH